MKESGRVLGHQRSTRHTSQVSVVPQPLTATVHTEDEDEYLVGNSSFESVYRGFADHILTIYPKRVQSKETLHYPPTQKLSYRSQSIVLSPNASDWQIKRLLQIKQDLLLISMPGLPRGIQQVSMQSRGTSKGAKKRQTHFLPARTVSKERQYSLDKATELGSTFSISQKPAAKLSHASLLQSPTVSNCFSSISSLKDGRRTKNDLLLPQRIFPRLFPKPGLKLLALLPQTQIQTQPSSPTKQYVETLQRAIFPLGKKHRRHHPKKRFQLLKAPAPSFTAYRPKVPRIPTSISSNTSIRQSPKQNKWANLPVSKPS